MSLNVMYITYLWVKVQNFQTPELLKFNLKISSLNGQLLWDKLIREAIIICLIQYFEADFLLKVSHKILNSGLILKAFTHAYQSSDATV